MILLTVFACVLVACENMTPEKAQAYANVAHNVATNTIQDYKNVKPLVTKP